MNSACSRRRCRCPRAAARFAASARSSPPTRSPVPARCRCRSPPARARSGSARSYRCPTTPAPATARSASAGAFRCPSITRKTDKGLPQYLDAVDSDVFILSGAEDLVPVYRQDPDGTWVAGRQGFQRDADGFWVRDPSGRLVMHEDELDGYRVRRYRPRIEGLFARIERWSKIGSPGDVHWRSISKDNILTLYGHDANSRIADPLDASRIFSG